jgi:hypothetical protein
MCNGKRFQYLPDNVRGGHKIYVVASSALKFEHHFGQLVCRCAGAVREMADVVVLAENAAEIAAGKKDRSRAVRAHKWGFFSEVRPVTGQDGLAPGATVAEFVFEPVGPAVTRAEVAAFELRDRFSGSLGYLFGREPH